MTLNDIMEIPYIDNGRDLSGCDCYGVVRLARHYLFGRELMPMFGAVDGSNKRQLTDAVKKTESSYRKCSRSPGAIATAWRGRVCLHVGVVVISDGRQMILESESGYRLPKLTPPRVFEARYSSVIYYDN